MGLEDLNEELYRRNVKIVRKQNDIFDPERKDSENTSADIFQKKELWQQPVKGMDPIEVLNETTYKKKVRIIAFVISGIIILSSLVVATIKIRSMIFDETQVVVSISGSKDVVSAEEIPFNVNYENNNWGSLHNAEIELSYPDTFHIIEDGSMKVNGSGKATLFIGEIPAHTQKKMSFKGKFYGSKGDKITLQATLKYAPKNLSSALEKTSQMIVTLVSSPFFVEINAPLEIVTGQNIEYIVDYGNKSDKNFSHLRVKIDYPSDFQFLNAEPKPSEGESIWYIDNLNTYEKGKIIIRGTISGVQKEYKNVHGAIGFYRGDNTFVSYAENERQTRMIASPLFLSQTVNNSTELIAGAGETLQYVIHYKNDGDIGLRDSIIIAEIDPTFLDLSRLSLLHGSYDGIQHRIIWKASDVPALKQLPVGGEGSVSFSVPVKSILQADDKKNITIKTVVKMDSLDIPTPIGSNKIIASNTLLVKLKSDAIIDAYALYTDTSLTNSGPIPPKVGQETSYTIHLSVAHSLSDIQNAEMVLHLPAGVLYKERYSPVNASFIYNERSNEIVWNIGSVSSEEKMKEIAFQVSIIPGPDRLGREMILVNDMDFTGLNTFTNEKISKKGPTILNTLKRDAVYKGMTTAGQISSAD